MKLGDIPLLGFDRQTGERLLLTAGLLVVVALLHILGRAVYRWLLGSRQVHPRYFWTRHGLTLVTSLITVLGLLSIWFNDAEQLSTSLGLVTAGLAFALQSVIIALVGYVVILRGHSFTVGDRITMGGVRGDVIALGFLHTTIMEIGGVSGGQGVAAPSWVPSRQYTGRIVTVANDKIFRDPVYNYTRDFAYLWEELTIPIPYAADRAQAEQLLLAAVRRHTSGVNERGQTAFAELQRHYVVRPADFEPQVYYRLTDNWLELSVRFLVDEQGTRAVKDRISRDVLAGLDAAGIEIASATLAIVQVPPLRWAAGTDGSTPPAVLPQH